MHDVLIVGSGVSGAAAALRFVDKGVKPCLVDVGLTPPAGPVIRDNLYAFRNNNDSFSVMTGEDFEGLINLRSAEPSIPAKLASPLMSFVTGQARELSPLDAKGFDVIQSFGQGGLAGAWGAGLYRYDDRDLEDFPIGSRDLIPYYDRLTEEIGISGENDDLTPFFGKDGLLQKPLRPSAHAAKIIRKYERMKKGLNAKGIFIGRPRLAVLTEEREGREACDYGNLEFWQPGLSHIYSPAMTLKKLIRDRKLIYQPGLLVKSWDRRDSSLTVHAERVENRESVDFRCRILVLAAGAVGSARLALQTRKDNKTKLPLLDNPALQFPFVFPARIGAKLEQDAFGLTQLNLVYDSHRLKGLLQGSLLEVTSPSRAEFFSHFPWAARDNLRLLRYVLPALAVLQLFFPADASNAAEVGLQEDGKLRVRAGKDRFDPEIKKDILRLFRRLGAFSIPSLVVEVPKGQSLHYAGTLPMRANPRVGYTCNSEGELFGEPDVFVADGSVFPVLPAKNLSFALMANAMRTADCVVRRLRD